MACASSCPQLLGCVLSGCGCALPIIVAVGRLSHSGDDLEDLLKTGHLPTFSLFLSLSLPSMVRATTAATLYAVSVCANLHVVVLSATMVETPPQLFLRMSVLCMAAQMRLPVWWWECCELRHPWGAARYLCVFSQAQIWGLPVPMCCLL